MRKSGLNIMMSMKNDAKPVSFIEDCAVELKDLAEYTDGLNKIFDKYNVKGTGTLMHLLVVCTLSCFEYENSR